MKELCRKTIPPTLYAALEKVATVVKTNGGKAYVVGGSVRDMLMGSGSVKDIDIEVFGITPEKLKSVLSEHFDLDLVGLSFGVVKLRHLDIDVSLPRRESKRGTGHKGFDIESDPFLSVEEAATRRDFTVNAVYFDFLENKTVDPFNGARRLWFIANACNAAAATIANRLFFILFFLESFFRVLSFVFPYLFSKCVS